MKNETVHEAIRSVADTVNDICDMDLWSFLKKKMMEHPDQIVCENHMSMTYKKLCALAESYARNLNSGYYGVLCKSEISATMFLLACIAAKKNVIPFPFKYGKEIYVKIWDKSEPPYILTDFDERLSVLAVPSIAENDPPAPPALVVLFDEADKGCCAERLLNEADLFSEVRKRCVDFVGETKDGIVISKPLCHFSTLVEELLVSLCQGVPIVFSFDSHVR